MAMIKSGAGVVYFANKPGTTEYKVGCSRDPFHRIKQLMQDSQNDLELVLMIYSDDIFKDEKEIHRVLKYYKMRGEWFNITNRNELIRIAKHYGEDVITIGPGKPTEGNKKLVQRFRTKINVFKHWHQLANCWPSYR